MKKKIHKPQFSYATIQELGNLSDNHPLLKKIDEDKSFDYLQQCPGVEGDFPFAFYLHQDDLVLSSVFSIPDSLIFNEKKHKWAWTGGLLTHPDFRGKGLASNLLKQQVRILQEKNIAWGAVFSNNISMRIFRNLGFIIPGYAKRYLMLKSIKPFLKYHLKNMTLTNITDRIYKKGHACWLLYSKLYKVKEKEYIVSEIKIHDPSLSKLFSQLKSFNEYNFDQSLEMLKWKAKKREIDKLYLIRDKSSSTLCFLVIRNRTITRKYAGKYDGFNLMTLMDYGFFSDTIEKEKIIMSAVINIFLKSHADVLEIISSSPKFNRHAKRLGLLKIGKGMSFEFMAPDNWNLPQDVKKISNWHLTHYSGDAFSFE